jgi:hypothetical protein
MIECSWVSRVNILYRGFHTSTFTNSSKISSKSSQWTHNLKSEFLTPPPNILIIEQDSTSRLNFRRNMHETLKILQEELGAVEILGFTKGKLLEGETIRRRKWIFVNHGMFQIIQWDPIPFPTLAQYSRGIRKKNFMKCAYLPMITILMTALLSGDDSMLQITSQDLLKTAQYCRCSIT